MSDQSVAITGALTSMEREAAWEVISRQGGRPSRSVNRGTTLLVVGRDGWPLQRDGKPSRKLRQARQFRDEGRELEIIAEEELLRRLQFESLREHICRDYSVPDLAELLKLPRARLTSWQRRGIITPTRNDSGRPYFDFRQVAAARSLIRFLEDGLSPRRLFRNILQLQSWLPIDIIDVISGMQKIGNRVAFRTRDGRLVEPGGQFLLALADDPSPAAIVSGPGAVRGERLFEEALQLEQRGRLAEAAQRYRELLRDEGPDADVCFNLANVLLGLGEHQDAIERLQQAVVLDPLHTDAWNNLGNLLAHENRLVEAVSAYRQALSLEADYADAHYGLADVLEQLWRPVEARTHWNAYLREEVVGPWADYARERLLAGPFLH
jgi:DNA-binding transcriptional MerR regulator